MRVVTKFALLAVVLIADLSFGQQPPAVDKIKAEKATKPVPSVEELLKDVLGNSPDIQVAEAKVHEAEAELRRTRLSLAQRVIDLHAALEAQRQLVKASQAELDVLTAQARGGNAPQSAVLNLAKQHERVKAELARLEATLNVLTGATPGMPTTTTGRAARTRGTSTTGSTSNTTSGTSTTSSTTAGRRLGAGFPTPFSSGLVGSFSTTALGGNANGPKDPMAEKISAALEAPFKMKEIKDAPLSEVLKQFQAAAPDVPFLIELGDKKDLRINLPLTGEIPLRAAFQAVQDVAPGLQCYIRQYGILVTFDGGE